MGNSGIKITINKIRTSYHIDVIKRGEIGVDKVCIL